MGMVLQIQCLQSTFLQQSTFLLCVARVLVRILWLTSSSQFQPGTLLPAPSDPFSTFVLLGALVALRGLPVLVWCFLIRKLHLFACGQLPALE